MKEHRDSRGRLRPETAVSNGGTRRGVCRICAGPKKVHTKFSGEKKKETKEKTNDPLPT